MNTTEIAENGDARHIFAVKSEDARGLRAETRCTVWRGNVAMDMVMVHIVGGGDLGEETSDHLDDIRDRHGADLVLAFLQPLPGHLVLMCLGQKLFAREALDMRKIADFDAARRCGLRVS